MQIKTVNAPTLQSWIDNDEVIIIDVREPDEHAAQNITGATLIPLGTLSSNLIPDLKGKKLVMHCKGGGRSAKACGLLLKDNPDLDVYNLEGGIRAWVDAGNKVNGTEGNFGGSCGLR